VSPSPENVQRKASLRGPHTPNAINTNFSRSDICRTTRRFSKRAPLDFSIGLIADFSLAATRTCTVIRGIELRLKRQVRRPSGLLRPSSQRIRHTGPGPGSRAKQGGRAVPSTSTIAIAPPCPASTTLLPPPLAPASGQCSPLNPLPDFSTGLLIRPCPSGRLSC